MIILCSQSCPSIVAVSISRLTSGKNKVIIFYWDSVYCRKVERGYAEKISRLAKANESTLSQNVGLVSSNLSAEVTEIADDEEEEGGDEEEEEPVFEEVREVRFLT